MVNCIPSGQIMIEVDHLAPNLRTQYAVQDLYSADQTDLPQESMCYSIHTDLMASQFQRRKKTDDCRNVMLKCLFVLIHLFSGCISRGTQNDIFCCQGYFVFCESFPMQLVVHTGSAVISDLRSACFLFEASALPSLRTLTAWWCLRCARRHADRSRST